MNAATGASLPGSANAGLESFRSAFDVQQMEGLKRSANQGDKTALEAVAKQFESLFINLLMQNMRQASESLTGEGLFDSNAGDKYQEMHDQQMALSLSQGQGIGLSEMLVRQLSQGSGSSPGRTHELNAQPNTAPNTGPSPDAPAPAAPLDQAPVPRTPEDFVSRLKPLTDAAAAEHGLSSRALLAQAALETGWGRHLPQKPDGTSSHNLFGIKADARWDGPQVRVNTLEVRHGVARPEQAAFRAYASWQQSLDDYVDFVRQSPRYEEALAQASDPSAYVAALQRAGYATDPEYADKIERILASDTFQALADTSQALADTSQALEEGANAPQILAALADKGSS